MELKNKEYDFCGWATRNDLLCADGRTIRKDAFKHNDGQTVPLVWNHCHNDPFNVLGHAVLENRNEGVYTYCYFNNTAAGEDAKEIVKHGDVVALSIYANKLKQNGNDVIHGSIREVSLVLAGANPGAYIDAVLEHGEEIEDSAVMYVITDEPEVIVHDGISDKGDAVDENGVGATVEKKEEPKMAEEQNEKTIQEVFDGLSEEEKNVVYALIGAAVEEATGKESKEEDDEEDMKHNVFDNDARQGNYLSHSDMQLILSDAKRIGSLKEAVMKHKEDGVLAHTSVPSGIEDIDYATGTQTYGFNDPDMLFPEYRALSAQPEWIKRDTGWVAEIMQGVHHTPFSRIKSMFANLTEDDARAKGYLKGHLKKDQVFSLLKRTTDPQTIYKRQKLDRDDIIDITDFDVVAWIKSEMRGMLDEEIARAILIGDGRLGSSDDKISPDHIRPIATDNELFTISASLNADATADDLIDEAIRARKGFKGTGAPTFFTTEDWLTECLLLKDDIGHRLYKDAGEVATAIRAKKITTVEVMEGVEINGEDLVGILVNPADYNVGADKGGAVSLFDDFDIDYNQQKYLIETRCSGALIKPFSAIVITKKKS